ncbi:MAG: L-histidine N(alpha)-methyltransferase [Sporichthyaceae bacterium]|nr:L-histidine N(alpha)-methyltransferase [Sporichthyaceae bacterium]
MPRPGLDHQLSIDRRLPTGYLAASLRVDVARGLTATPKWLPPRWLYDARGSALFDRITRLPGYYLSSAEREILAATAPEIAAITAADTLIELGSGSSAKTRSLLDALDAAGTLGRYVPVDVSEGALLDAGTALIRDYPRLHVHAVLADFTAGLGGLPAGGRRLVAFFGSTYGNLTPVERAGLLAELRRALAIGDGFLLGIDLIKDPALLVSAYDDPAGITAEFNRNVLYVLNRELGADFRPDAFRYQVRWNPQLERIETWLHAEGAQSVVVRHLALAVDFADGEALRTAISTKFHRAGVQAELERAEFRTTRWWTDRAERFALVLAVPTAG